MLDDKELISLLYQTIARDSLKLASVSDDLGVAPETISRWKKSGKLGRSNRDALAVWLASKGVDLEAELMKNRLPSPPPERPKIVPNAFFINAAETFKPVPLLTIAQAKELMPHGLGAANDIPADSLVHFPHVSPGDFAVQIAGNSMMPWYPPGTQLLVSREAKPQTGNRVIAMLADYAEPLFKIYIDLGGRFALYSINEQDGCAPLELDKMDKGETWYWVWKIKVSARDEDAVDAAMKEFGIHHGWEKWLEKRQAEQ